MTPSSRDAAASSGPDERGFLLVLLLAADFMVFAALVGTGIVLDEGAKVWAPPAVAEALRGRLPFAGLALLGSLCGFVPVRGVVAAGFALAALGWTVEAAAVLRAGIGGSYGALFLATAAYAVLHLAISLLSHARLGVAAPRPFLFFTAAIGLAALPLLHWPLYSF